MDIYTIAKFLHVALAIIWLGGGLALVILAVLAQRARDDAQFMTVVRQVETLAPRVFVPGSLLVLVLGLYMVWSGGLGWDAWIVLALIGIVTTIGLGIAVLKPLAERSAALAGSGKAGEALAVARRLVAVAKFDMTLLFTIVFLMVTRPGWTDWPELLVVALAVALGAVAFLRPRRGAVPAAAL